MTRKPRILVVDDDDDQLQLLQRTLSAEGFDVMTTSSPLGASNLARRFIPDVVLLDVNLPALSGDRLLPLLRQSMDARLILFSACDAERLRSLASRVSADDWIQKGGEPQDLVRRLKKLCDVR